MLRILFMSKDVASATGWSARQCEQHGRRTMPLGRVERLQIMLTDEELAAIDDWGFERRMPTRAAAVRELLQRGLSAEGFVLADRSVKSKNFGVVMENAKCKPANGRPPAKP